MLRSVTVALLALVPSSVGPRQSGTPDDALLADAFRQQGIELDRARGFCSIPVQVEVRDALLEYLLVGAGGAAHESLFLTRVAPSVLNAALLLLGAEPGQNATWQPKDPPPTPEQLQDGVSPWNVEVPRGFGLALYVGWKQGGETYFYRVEDLLRDLARGRSMQRHRWIYLGSRMVPSGDPSRKDELVYAADLFQNVINVSYFAAGYTVLTAALPESVEQTIWMPNAWLIPERGELVRLFFATDKLETLPADVAASLPEVAAPKPYGQGQR